MANLTLRVEPLRQKKRNGDLSPLEAAALRTGEALLAGWVGALGTVTPLVDL